MSGKPKPAKGASFNYDPSNYKDSNDANYRRLGDQLAAVKSENDKMARERDEIIRKEQMAAMFLKKENATFWETKGDTIVATSDKFFVPPQVLQIIDDLDNQLIGLKPVKEKMKRYANQMLIHKIRSYVFSTPPLLSLRACAKSGPQTNPTPFFPGPTHQTQTSTTTASSASSLRSLLSTTSSPATPARARRRWP